MNRDYTSISPSAKALLLMKGLTNIPYAKKTAELISSPEKYDAVAQDKEAAFLFRVLHFEDRYWSIDQLLSALSVTNILELSSGFSFRGLAMAETSPLYYIDTDLPELIAQKKELQARLNEEPVTMRGTLEIASLNALDEAAFNELIGHFPPGPVTIVNEGLLMYLGMAEKEKLCSTIHKVLKERGGYWITADIYVRNKTIDTGMNVTDKEKKFFEQHHIEENKFESFEEAAAFFTKAGFVLDKVADTDHDKLSVLPYIMQKISPETRGKMAETGRIQETWRLKAAE